MHPKYPVIASIIAAITFVSAFTYQLAGFFLKQDYTVEGCNWIDAKKRFQIYFRFVNDGNTELVMNGVFGIFVLLFLGDQKPSFQCGVTWFFVLLKLVINYHGHEIVTDYCYGRDRIWDLTRGCVQRSRLSFSTPISSFYCLFL